MDRRTFLVLTAAAVGTSGCTGRSPAPRPSTARPAPDPDAALLQRVAESEAALIAAYRTTLASTPELAPTIEPILRQHTAHLARVAPDWTPSTATSAPSPAPKGSGADEPPPTSAVTGTVGTNDPARSPSASPADVLSRLSAAESAARDQRIAACDAARNPTLARELCLIGASEAQHAVVLADAAGGSGP